MCRSVYIHQKANVLPFPHTEMIKIKLNVVVEFICLDLKFGKSINDFFKNNNVLVL